MLKNIFNLKGIEILSKTQQKGISGGSGSCCVTVVGNVSTDRQCGMSKQEAIDEADTVASWGDVRAYWCCASC